VTSPNYFSEIASHSAGVVISEALVWHSLMRNSQSIYSTEELQAFELLVLSCLDWDLNAVTPVFWRELILEFIEQNIDQERTRRSPMATSVQIVAARIIISGCTMVGGS